MLRMRNFASGLLVVKHTHTKCLKDQFKGYSYPTRLCTSFWWMEYGTH